MEKTGNITYYLNDRQVRRQFCQVALVCGVVLVIAGTGLLIRSFLSNNSTELLVGIAMIAMSIAIVVLRSRSGINELLVADGRLIIQRFNGISEQLQLAELVISRHYLLKKNQMLPVLRIKSGKQIINVAFEGHDPFWLYYRKKVQRTDFSISSESEWRNLLSQFT